MFGPSIVAAVHLPGWDVQPGRGAVTSDDADLVLVDSTHAVRWGDPEVTGVSDTFSLGRVTVLVLE